MHLMPQPSPLYSSFDPVILCFFIPAFIFGVLAIMTFNLQIKNAEKAAIQKRIQNEEEEKERLNYPKLINRYKKNKSDANIPDSALTVKNKLPSKDTYRNYYLWKSINKLCFFPYLPSFDEALGNNKHIDIMFKYTTLEIPIDNIEFFTKAGEVFHETQISGGGGGGGGGGGSSLKGAVVGEVIAGDVGAIIGSRKGIKIDPIQSKLVTHDNRAVVLKYINENNKKVEMNFHNSDYDIFNELIPEKASEIVNAIRAKNIINNAASGETKTTITKLLRELGKLKDEGILTDEEFQQKKRELLLKM